MRYKVEQFIGTWQVVRRLGAGKVVILAEYQDKTPAEVLCAVLNAQVLQEERT
jgi:hypothetical protein